MIIASHYDFCIYHVSTGILHTMIKHQGYIDFGLSELHDGLLLAVLNANMEIVFYDIIDGNPTQNVTATINVKSMHTNTNTKTITNLKLYILENNKHIAVLEDDLIVVFEISSKYIVKFIKQSKQDRCESFQNGECLLIKGMDKTIISYSIDELVIKKYDINSFSNIIDLKSYNSTSLMVVSKWIYNKIVTYSDFEKCKIIAETNFYHEGSVFRYSYDQYVLNKIFTQLSHDQKLKLLQLNNSKLID